MEEVIYNALELVCSTKKLERDKGLIELEKHLACETAVNSCLHKTLQKQLVNKLMDSESSWEVKYGCLLAAKSALSFITFDSEFNYHVQTLATKLLTDDEGRVRLAAADVLGIMCQKVGSHIYVETKNTIFKLIQDNLSKIVDLDADYSLEQVGLLGNRARPGSQTMRRYSDDSLQSYYELTGWKHLETSLRALQNMANGCGSTFVPFIDDELVALIFKTLTHSNHIVRISGFQMCATVLQCTMSHKDESQESYGIEFSHHLANGLSDKWSQVRLAASVATRHFLLTMSEDARHAFYPQLLPPMCLNRYYIADGVRIYSQETWRQVAGTAGKELVQRYLGSIIEYYDIATTSENQAVREAVCACIAELANKIPAAAISNYVGSLLSILLVCFKDDSWAVRDAACLASGNFILCFPEESNEVLDDLYPMFYRNLGDSIGSVRQGAAAALCNVVRAYGEPALTVVMATITRGFEDLSQQKSPSENGSVRSQGDASHNLSPSSCVSTTQPQPWEFADGCIHLLGELSNIKDTHSRLIDLILKLKDVARHKHYSQHVVLLEAICRQIPVIAKNLGKKHFSTLVEQFFDAIFYALESENRLTSSAASQCLNQLAALLGQNILRAKVANFNPRYLTALESVIYVAPF